jgi:hypothetical protein
MNYSSFLVDEIKSCDKQSLPRLLKLLSSLGYDDYDILEHLQLDEQRYEDIVFYGGKLSALDLLYIKTRLVSFVKKNPLD